MIPSFSNLILPLLLLFPGEKHFRNVQQLTFGGDNAEAYWSFDSKKIVFQRTDHKEVMCDQIFFGAIPADSTQKFDFKMVSTGKGENDLQLFHAGRFYGVVCIYPPPAGYLSACTGSGKN
jgi:hypothetical protein